MTIPRKIWILFGGNSAEREVSLNSGRGIANALKTKGYDVQGFDVSPGPAFYQLPWNTPPDIVFIGLHGTWGEDGTIQGYLESLKIPYVGSGVLASAVSFHKGLAKKQMQQFGVPCAPSFDIVGKHGLDVFKKEGRFKDIVKKKWFIKPARQGSTIGIQRYAAEGDEHFLSLCTEALKFDDYLLVEEWIEGRELTVPLLHGRALPIVEIKPHSDFYNYESKYTKGKTEYFAPAALSEDVALKISHISELVFQSLGCVDYGRVDVMLRGDFTPFVLEMNTLPGMTETSLVPKSAAAAGMDYATFLEKLLLGSWKRQHPS